jgi:hypothetical protein
MGHTDSPVMSGRYGKLSTLVIWRLVLEAEAAQVAQVSPAESTDGYLVGFSTALTDEDRRYLDLCAELYARGEYAAGRQPCSEAQQEETAA